MNTEDILPMFHYLFSICCVILMKIFHNILQCNVITYYNVICHNIYYYITHYILICYNILQCNYMLHCNILFRSSLVTPRESNLHKA
jgi:hypothetical protein